MSWCCCDRVWVSGSDPSPGLSRGLPRSLSVLESPCKAARAPGLPELSSVSAVPALEGLGWPQHLACRGSCPSSAPVPAPRCSRGCRHHGGCAPWGQTDSAPCGCCCCWPWGLGQDLSSPVSAVDTVLLPSQSCCGAAMRHLDTAQGHGRCPSAGVSDASEECRPISLCCSLEECLVLITHGVSPI